MKSASSQVYLTIRIRPKATAHTDTASVSIVTKIVCDRFREEYLQSIWNITHNHHLSGWMVYLLFTIMYSFVEVVLDEEMVSKLTTFSVKPEVLNETFANEKKLFNLFQMDTLPLTDLPDCKPICNNGQNPLVHDNPAGSGDSSLKCCHCGKYFKFKYALERHKLTHSRERPFKCSSCVKCFMFQNHLNQHHREVHVGHKQFQCPDCHKCFYRRSDLNRHGSIHAETRPFGCCSCAKTFRNNYELKRHTLTHTRERSLQCSNCNKSFSFKNHLTQHFKEVHLGEKQFECQACSKCFFRKSDLKRHYGIHNGTAHADRLVTVETGKEQGNCATH
uniref:C2H2-type domain-containing protein n=1 Tax=Timema genevievae TaxID=629358 RepID=A0A7R9PH29_TIMGE|nr:unnamed protein product [Timema genevievae]